MQFLGFFARRREGLELLIEQPVNMLTAILFLSAAAAVFLLFPIFLSVNIFIDFQEKKGFFSLHILRFIKIYGGYATLYGKGIAFHLTKSKAVLLPFASMLDTGKKFEITKGFYIYAYSGVIEIGAKSRAVLAVAASALVQTAASIAAGFVFNRKKCASFKNDTVIYEENDCVKANFRVILLFNFLIVIIAGLKILLQKIIERVQNHERKNREQKS